jgi:hypothetical protein
MILFGELKHPDQAHKHRILFSFQLELICPPAWHPISIFPSSSSNFMEELVPSFPSPYSLYHFKLLLLGVFFFLSWCLLKALHILDIRAFFLKSNMCVYIYIYTYIYIYMSNMYRYNIFSQTFTYFNFISFTKYRFLNVDLSSCSKLLWFVCLANLSLLQDYGNRLLFLFLLNHY